MKTGAFSAEEEKILRDNFPHMDRYALGALMDRDPQNLCKAAATRGLRKSDEYMRELNKRRRMMCAENSVATRFKPVHGQSGDKAKGSTYNAWQSMIRRCIDPKHKSFASYGGAGISICDRWRNSYVAFLEDMGTRPKGTTLDRFPNMSGNYEPGNCRWATPSEQARNKKTTVRISAFGETLMADEWEKKTGVKACTILWRIKRGVKPEIAVALPATIKGSSEIWKRNAEARA